MLYYFFFQAEDGIRDLTVTGVQTCALPISFVMGDDARLGGGGADGSAPCPGEHRRLGRGRRQIPLVDDVVVKAAQIGRASGRGRGGNSGVAGSFKKKKKRSSMSTMINQ